MPLVKMLAKTNPNMGEDAAGAHCMSLARICPSALL